MRRSKLAKDFKLSYIKLSETSIISIFSIDVVNELYVLYLILYPAITGSLDRCLLLLLFQESCIVLPILLSDNITIVLETAKLLSAHSTPTTAIKRGA